MVWPRRVIKSHVAGLQHGFLPILLQRIVREQDNREIDVLVGELRRAREAFKNDAVACDDGEPESVPGVNRQVLGQGLMRWRGDFDISVFAANNVAQPANALRRRNFAGREPPWLPEPQTGPFTGEDG